MPVLETEEGRRILGEFSAAITEVREWRTKADDEIKKFGTVKTETLEEIRKVDAKAEDAGKKLVEYGERIEKIEGDLRTMKQRNLRLPGGGAIGGDGTADGRSFGERFVQS